MHLIYNKRRFPGCSPPIICVIALSFWICAVLRTLSPEDAFDLLLRLIRNRSFSIISILSSLRIAFRSISCDGNFSWRIDQQSNVIAGSSGKTTRISSPILMYWPGFKDIFNIATSMFLFLKQFLLLRLVTFISCKCYSMLTSVLHFCYTLLLFAKKALLIVENIRISWAKSIMGTDFLCFEWWFLLRNVTNICV